MRLNAIGQNDPANLIQVLKVGNIFSQRVSYLYHKFILRFINGVHSYKVSCENELWGEDQFDYDVGAWDFIGD